VPQGLDYESKMDRTEREPRRRFIPAAGHDWLLPLYDPIQRLMGGHAARGELLGRAGIEAGHRVLDVGCGTGDLVVQLGRLCPNAEVVGLDPDPKALARARRKAERVGLRVQLDEGFSDALPYADASFDRVLSTFMLHHLGSDEKRGTLREIRRVLRPGGALHVLDFGGPSERPDSLLARLLHASDHLRDNFGGRLLALMREAGFASAEEIGHRRSLFGRIAHIRAV
jgi:SAM-dependent methyltransferase